MHLFNPKLTLFCVFLYMDISVLRKYWSMRACVRACICPHGITMGVLKASIVLKFLLYIYIVFLFDKPIF